mmetsp:Transcript_24615/g.76045  ORF Transcript_24615/g.76045 Transcript_24615/m.76045 type:complete len:279 (-) Transcript_24615:863-1699(-)
MRLACAARKKAASKRCCRRLNWKRGDRCALGLFPAASASVCRSPWSSCTLRRCSSWTSPRPVWTRASPSPWSRRCATSRGRRRRRSSRPSTSRPSSPSSPSTASSCSPPARSPSAAPSPRPAPSSATASVPLVVGVNLKSLLTPRRPATTTTTTRTCGRRRSCCRSRGTRRTRRSTGRRTRNARWRPGSFFWRTPTLCRARPRDSSTSSFCTTPRTSTPRAGPHSHRRSGGPSRCCSRERWSRAFGSKARSRSSPRPRRRSSTASSSSNNKTPRPAST